MQTRKQNQAKLCVDRVSAARARARVSNPAGIELHESDGVRAHRKKDPAKLEIAARRRQETAFSIKDMAARVPSGTSKTANRKLHDPLRRRPAYDSAQAQLAF
jgi:hypothetical protein